MIKLISLIGVLFLFSACANKVYHSPEIDALVVDIETMQPLENVRVVDMQQVGIVEDKDHNTEESLSDKNGCINIAQNSTTYFNIVPVFGVGRSDSKLNFKHPEYSYDDVIIKSLTMTEHASYIFGLCKKTSQKCIPKKWIYLRYEDIFEYDDDFNEYKKINIYDGNPYKDDKENNIQLIKIPKDKAFKCFKRYKKEE